MNNVNKVDCYHTWIMHTRAMPRGMPRMPAQTSRNTEQLPASSTSDSRPRSRRCNRTSLGEDRHALCEELKSIRVQSQQHASPRVLYVDILQKHSVSKRHLSAGYVGVRHFAISTPLTAVVPCRMLQYRGRSFATRTVMRVSTIKPAMAARKYHWRARACRNTAKGSARRHSMIGGREKRSTNDQDRPGNVAHIERARGAVAACVVAGGPKH